MEQERRDILNQVAQGVLSPEEAAARLDEVASRAAAHAASPGVRGQGTAGGEAAPPGGPALRIRVSRTAGPAEVVGDPGVKEAVAEGPHTVRREGDVLVIDGSELDEDGAGFWFSRSDRQRFRIGLGGVTRPLQVRVNPDLPLEAAVQAGSLSVRGVRGPIQCTVQAGATTIEGFQGPLDLSVQAGSVKGSGRLSVGASRIKCEAGSVRLHLAADSSVRVSARATMGKVSIDGEAGPRDSWMLGGSQEAILGDGRATLEIEATMGSVKVSGGG